MAVNLTLAEFKDAVNQFADALTPYKQTAGDARPSTVINDDVQAARILASVSALIEAEIGDNTGCPQELQNHCTIKLGAYEADSLRPIASLSFSENRSAISLGANTAAALDRNASYRSGHGLRATGVRAMLWPWRGQSI